ncbi:MAG: DnaJ domain-containing protein [Verrucomicrobiota bacterium]
MRGKFFRVTDCFALFGFPRRPALDAAALKEKYLQQAACAHPDAGKGDDDKFRTVQQAYQTLRDPAARLRHLLALQFGGWKKKSLPAHQDLFLKVGEALQRAMAFQQRLEKSQTSLARALLAQDRETALGRIRKVSQSVAEARSVLERELIALDARWPEVRPEELGNLAAGLTFLTRWQSELRETGFRLEHAGG